MHMLGRFIPERLDDGVTLGLAQLVELVVQRIWLVRGDIVLQLLTESLELALATWQHFHACDERNLRHADPSKMLAAAEQRSRG
jgi:hypothetical protein